MEITQFSQAWNKFHFSQLNKWIEDNPQYALFSGSSGSSDAFLISDLFRTTKKTVIVFVESSKKAENLVDECKTFIDDESVLLFPSRDAVPYNLKSPFGPTIEMRYKVLSSLLSGNTSIIISPYTTLSQKIMPRGNLFKKIIR